MGYTLISNLPTSMLLARRPPQIHISGSSCLQSKQVWHSKQVSMWGYNCSNVPNLMGVYRIASLTWRWCVGITSWPVSKISNSSTPSQLSKKQPQRLPTSFQVMGWLSECTHRAVVMLVFQRFFNGTWRSVYVSVSDKGTVDAFHSLVLMRSTLQHRKVLLPQSKSS